MFYRNLGIDRHFVEIIFDSVGFGKILTVTKSKYRREKPDFSKNTHSIFQRFC